MKYIYIANWKMYLSFSESINFCLQNYNSLKKLSHNADIIICPSFVALTSIIEIFKNSTIAVGAQNCSEYISGPYTGEVSAQTLTQAGVRYCIVGHSERRIHYGETSDIITQKIALLYEHSIQPIICIGETEKEYHNKTTFTALAQQLESIISAIQHNNNHIIIAYEPIGSIGTDIIPEQHHLQEVFIWLTEWLTTHLPDNSIQLLYGGSVNSTNIKQLKKIPHINGFLIGKASTDFESFAKIII